MPSPSQDLIQVFRKGRALLFSIAFIEAAVAALIGAIFSFALALIFLELLSFSEGLRRGLWALMGVAPVASACFLLFYRGRKLANAQNIALAFEEAARRRGVELDDGLRSAAAFIAEDDLTRGSTELKEAHILKSLRSLDESGAFFSLSAVGLQSALLTLTLAFFSFIVAGIGLGFWSNVLALGYAQLFDDKVAEEALVAQAKSETPVVSDLKITLSFPAYQNRKSTTVLGASGSIFAPRGTQVLVEGRTDRRFRSVVLLLGDKKIVAEKIDEFGVRARFVVEKEEEYRFKLKEMTGLTAMDPMGHRIQLQLDESPKVELTADKVELRVKARREKEAKKIKSATRKSSIIPEDNGWEEENNERVIQLDDKIEVQGFATDDFGLSAFDVFVLKNDEEVPFRKKLARLNKPLRMFRVKGHFSAREAGARPGDLLVVRIEVKDNDNVTGPNIGSSRARSYRIFSAARHHRALIEKEQELLFAMVDALAQDLTHLVPRKAYAKIEVKGELVEIKKGLRQQQKVLRLLEQVLADLEKDELRPKGVLEALWNMRTELRPLVSAQRQFVEGMQKSFNEKKKIQSFSWRRLYRNQQDRIGRLERHILFLEDLLNQQRLDEARQLSEELKGSQEKLAELIEQYKKTGDEEDRRKLLGEIKRMQNKMQELMKRLGDLRQEVPDQYLNHEAFETSKMQEQAQSLDDLIESGDLEKAADALKKMLEQTQKMVEELDESRERYGDDEYKEQRKKLENFSQELSALEAAQEEMVKKTESLMKSAQQEAERQMKDSFADKIKEIQKEVKGAEKMLEVLDGNQLNFSGMDALAKSRARLSDVWESLARNDVEEALQAAISAEQHLDEVRGAAGNQLFRAFQRAKEQAEKNLEQVDLAQEHAQKAKELLFEMMPKPEEMLSPSQRKQLQRDAKRQKEMQKQAQELAQKMQELGEEMPVFGDEHQQKLQEAGQKMGKATRALREKNLRGARREQESARNGLKDLREALEQMGGQGSGGGMPMALPSSGMGQKGSGNSGSHNDDDEVEIPDADSYRVPDAFRRDILDAMREEAPAGWQDEVKRYYEELVK